MSERIEARTPWYRRPVFLTVLACIALLALASAVFTVSVQARSLSDAAQEAYGLNETLRVASGVRSDLSIANGLRTIGGAGFDASSSMEVALTNAETGAANLSAAMRDLDASEFTRVREAVFGFVNSSSDHVVAARRQAPSLEPLDTEAAVDSAFAEVVTALDDARKDTLGRMESINDTMNRVGSVAGYGVAFVVPALALYIYESLRRTRLRARLAEQRSDRLSSTARRSASESSAVLAQVESAIARVRHDPTLPLGTDRRSDLDAAAARLAELQNDSLARGASSTTQIETIPVGPIVELAIQTSGVRGVEVSMATESDAVLGDAAHIRQALAELLRNASQHGGPDIRITAFQEDSAVTFAVTDNGDGISDEFRRALFQEDTLELRRKLYEGQLGTGLLAVRSRVESMGTRLAYQRGGSSTQFSFSLPVAAQAVVPAPAAVESIPLPA